MHTRLMTKTTTAATTATTMKTMAMATIRVRARNQGNEGKGSTYGHVAIPRYIFFSHHEPPGTRGS
jgi:hypothetical protein